MQIGRNGLTSNQFLLFLENIYIKKKQLPVTKCKSDHTSNIKTLLQLVP